MRYHPAHAATTGRWPSSMRLPKRLKVALSIAAATAIGIMPAIFISPPAAYAVGSPGDADFSSDIEDTEGATFVFELRRLGGSSDPMNLSCQTADGTATAPADYAAIPATAVNFAAGSRDIVKRFSIATVDDALDEDDETFTITCTGTTGAPGSTTPITPITATATIDDNDPTPSYTLSTSNPVAESAVNAVITATLSAVSGRNVVIPISTSDGSAVAGEDYTSTSTNITITAGSLTGTANVPITDDAFDEPDIETFTVAGSTGNHGETLSGGNLVVQIQDNDNPPTISLAGAGNVVEGGTLTFVASINAPSKRNVTLQATTTDIEATAGADYTALNHAPFTITAGTTSVNIPVTTLTDSLNEVNPETLSVTISNLANANAGTPMTATGGITDDDLPPALTLSPSSVTEGNSGTAVPQTFTVGLGAPSGRTVHIGYQVNSGTATSGTDFLPVTAGTLTFAPGDTSKTFPISIVGDLVHEGNETFSIVLNDIDTAVAAGGAVGTNTITITDDDGVPVIQTMTPISRAEGNTVNTATFHVTVSNPSSTAITFDVTAPNGTAVSDGSGPGSHDFDVPAATVTIPAYATSVDLPVTVNGDTVYEGSESVTVTATAQGGMDVTGGPATAALTLTNDDDLPTIVVSSTSAVESSTPVPVTATVTGQAQAPITLTPSAAGASNAGSSAASPADFDSTGLAAGTINPGDATVSLGNLVFLTDLINEPDQTVRVTVTGTGGLATATAYETIQDAANNKLPQVSIADTPVTEGPATNAVVPVTLDFAGVAGNVATSTERTIVVHYATTDGTATAPGDYTAATAPTSTVTFAPGVDTQNISIPITNDNLWERTEAFTVTLSSPTPTITIARATATVTITDDDTGNKPGFTFTAPPSVSEAGGTANFTLALTTLDTQDVDFVISTGVGTADVAGTGPGSHDFNAPATTITIPHGTLSVTVPVTINQDTVYEGTETAPISADLAAGETDAMGGIATATLTILDDDAVPVVTLSSGSKAENNSLAVTATVSGVAQRAIPITLTAAGATNGPGTKAADNADFDASGLTATSIPAGDNTAAPLPLGSVAFLADHVDEPLETVKVTLTSGIVATAVGYEVIIDDANDLPPAISIGDVSVAEGVGNAAVPVTLTFDPMTNDATSTQQDTVVNYSTADGTAVSPADYTGTSTGTITILAADTLTGGSILVHIVDDSLFEPDETFTVTATSHTPTGTTPARATGTVTIQRSDDTARPNFSVAPVSRNEDASGPANFTIHLSSPATAPVSFTATMATGTATTGSGFVGSNDYTYTQPVGGFTIPRGSQDVLVPITVVADQIYEADETATLTVDLASGETNALGSATTAVLTILNDDAAPNITLNTGESNGEGSYIAIIATPDRAAQAAETFDLTFSGDSSAGNVAATPDDYVDSGAQGTIPAGTSAGTPVTLRTFRLSSDHIDEPVETIKVVVHDVAGIVADRTAYYKINDDPNDLPPSVSLGDTSVIEHAGPAGVPVTLTFDPATNDATSTTRPIVIGYMTVDGTAKSTSDYTAVPNGSLTIAPGVTSGTILVPITDDQRNEADETFSVKETSVSPPETTVTNDTSTVTIVDDDQNVPRPDFTVAPVSRNENAGNAVFTVTLDGNAAGNVDFTVHMDDGTAVDVGSGVGSNDFNQPASGTLTIPMGTRTGTVTVPVNGDSIYEADETATLHVALAATERDAFGDPKDATLTLINDDAKPVVNLTPPTSGFEGDTLPVAGTVTGLTQIDAGYDIAFTGDATGNNTPAADTDFDASGVSPQITVPGGTASGSSLTFGSVVLSTDTLDEATETFKAVISDPDDTVADRTTYYRIFDDPNTLPPTAAIDSIDVDENDGTAYVPVRLTMTGDTTDTEQNVTVNWTTADGTAHAPADYTGRTSTLTITPGHLTGAIPIHIVNDSVYAGNSEFTVRLTAISPAGAVISNSTATVTINDDEQPVAPTLVVPTVARAGAGAVTVTGTTSESAQVQLFTAPLSTPSTYSLVASTYAGVNGTYSFTRTIDSGFNLYTRSNGLLSPVRTVRITQVPTLAAVSSSKGTATLTVTGNPRGAGQVTYIQRQNPNGTWTNVINGKLSSTGVYAVTLTRLVSGSAITYRTVILDTPSLGILSGTSAAKRITIR